MLNRIQSKSSTYQLIELIGEGLTSWVYRAFKEEPEAELKELVALKLLKSKKYVENWRKELFILKELRSQNCVQYFGWEWINGSPGLVLEYINGVSLEELIRTTTLDSAEINEVLAQAGNGIRDLSKIGVCHGDISLKNILINNEGRVKLIDFGVFNTDGPEKQFTPEFAAPEVLAGELPTIYSDIYALGRVTDNLIRFSGNKRKPEVLKWLLQEKPKERRLPNIKSKKSLEEALAEKVRLAQDKLRYSFTKTIQQQSKKTKKLKPNIRQFFMALLVLYSGHWGHSIGKVKLKLGELSVRTKSWYSIKINEKDLGYTPLNGIRLPAGKHSVIWTSATEKGESTLTIQEGRHIVLDETFFNK